MGCGWGAWQKLWLVTSETEAESYSEAVSNLKTRRGDSNCGMLAWELMNEPLIGFWAAILGSCSWESALCVFGAAIDLGRWSWWRALCVLGVQSWARG